MGTVQINKEKHKMQDGSTKESREVANSPFRDKGQKRWDLEEDNGGHRDFLQCWKGPVSSTRHPIYLGKKLPADQCAICISKETDLGVVGEVGRW